MNAHEQVEIAPYQAKLQETKDRVTGHMTAQSLWDQVLSETDRNHLGDDFCEAFRNCGTIGMWKQLHGGTTERAIVEVAYALDLISKSTWRWLLRALGEIHDDPEEAIKAAVDSGDLVLVEGVRDVYWNGIKVNVDMSRRPASWEFFWMVCEYAKKGMPVNRFSFRSTVSRDVVAQQKDRLHGLGFPSSLIDLIKPIGRGTQQLDLPPQRIRLFELTSTDTLTERTA